MVRKVGFQGEQGAYSEIAAMRIGEPVAIRTFEDVFKAITDGRVDCGVLPIENSLGGAVYENYDLMLKYPVEVLAEMYVKIEHCLLGLQGASVESAREVLSHPQALSQCVKFLEENKHILPVATYDTAGSAKMIRASGDIKQLAIASERAAEMYGLKVLRRDLSDSRDNYTRFLVLAKRAVRQEWLAAPTKLSIALALMNGTDSLVEVLSLFKSLGIRLTKIDSRPLRSRPFEYIFYLDVVIPENVTSIAVDEVLSKLGNLTTLLVHFGSYKALSDCYGSQ
ncbi:MAG: prephenate dehydratase [Acidobacteriota bacterium]|nr:prephenate dehydratase [Blastocatellia bacterium]MDW8412510.1 prephenate dehydratase [Acidobacteriota bacterium]